MTVKCPHCKGTGDMGLFSSARCRVCGGTGTIALTSIPEAMLYEWMEGYMDEDTDDQWLEDQLKRLMEVRKKQRQGLLPYEEEED
jgi:RecJ-like exonuclease